MKLFFFHFRPDISLFVEEEMCILEEDMGEVLVLKLLGQIQILPFPLALTLNLKWQCKWKSCPGLLFFLNFTLQTEASKVHRREGKPRRAGVRSEWLFVVALPFQSYETAVMYV